MLLKTKRLLLREFEETDFEAFLSLVTDPEVMRFSLNGPRSTEQSKTEFKQSREGLFAILLQESGKIIGFAGLKPQMVDGEEEIELGYRLTPEYWNRGFASEAAIALTEYAFKHLSLTRLISIIDPENHRSLKVATKVGMHFWKKTLFHGIPVHIYCLTKIVIEPFQSSWAEAFEKEVEQLKEAFLGLEIEFHHIGSTSISNCSAKPIIDILGVTPDVTKVDAYNETMAELGYSAKGEFGIPQRRYFHRRPIASVNLHIFEETDPEVGRHLRFRNYLRKHPEKTKEYSDRKCRLAEQFPNDIIQYILGKERWIKEIGRMAAREIPTLDILKYEGLRKREWTSQEILKAMQNNMHMHMTYFAKYLPVIEKLFELDATVVRADIPDDTFNYVLFAKFNEKNVQDRVSHISSLYKKRRLPFSWWVGETDTPPQLAEVLIKEGLTFKEEDAGMSLNLETFHPKSSSHLDFRRVNSMKEVKDFCQIIVEIGGHPQIFELIYHQLPPSLYQEGSSFEMHVGYLQDQPIVTGILLLHANVAGIYYVATTPNQRKKGYGTEMMESLLQRAKSKGYSIATLQASVAGKGLYQRLGFEQCCLFKEYAWTPS